MPGLCREAAAWSDRLGNPLENPATPAEFARQAHSRGHDRGAVLAGAAPHNMDYPPKRWL